MEGRSVGKGTVVIVSEPGADAWWRRSILRRRDLKVFPARDYATALELMARVPCELLVVEERPRADLQAFLDRVRGSFAGPSFKMVFIGDSVAPDQPMPPVTRALPPGCPLDAFNLCLAQVLRIPPRRSQRHLVRIQMAFDAEGGAKVGMATTVDLSLHGMRIETGVAMDAGQRYLWAFSGVRELADVVVPGTVLREDVQAARGNLRCYAVQFDADAKRERRILEHYLAQRF